MTWGTWKKLGLEKEQVSEGETQLPPYNVWRREKVTSSEQTGMNWAEFEEMQWGSKWRRPPFQMPEHRPRDLGPGGSRGVWAHPALPGTGASALA